MDEFTERRVEREQLSDRIRAAVANETTDLSLDEVIARSGRPPSAQDRLAEIKATLHHWDTVHAEHGPHPLPPAVAAQESARHLNRAQIDWLIGEVERLQAKLAQVDNDISGPRRVLRAIRNDIHATLGWTLHEDDDEDAATSSR